jgi:aryl-alcohol dehydrogenase-like predicted oxidoreductase
LEFRDWELVTDGCILPVTALGFGAMGLSAFYGNQVSDEESHEVIKAAVDEGCTLIDTANVSSSLLNICAPQ